MTLLKFTRSFDGTRHSAVCCFLLFMNFHSSFNLSQNTNSQAFISPLKFCGTENYTRDLKDRAFVEQEAQNVTGDWVLLVMMHGVEMMQRDII